MNKKFYSQDKQNYKEETRASSLMISSKQDTLKLINLLFDGLLGSRRQVE